MALLPAWGCEVWDYPFNRPRSAVMAPDHGSRSREEGTGTVPRHAEDSIFICGVRTPEGYDWKRDTALGIGRGELVLLKDMREILSFPTGYAEGVSMDPDSHHLLGGHLYTEFSDRTNTVIRRDGELLLSYEGREFLAGMVIRGGDIYTLGCRRSGEGFTYRKNGEIVLDRPAASLYGSFADSSYPRTGALYEDCGKLVFAYRNTAYGSTTVHIVEDGVDNTFMSWSGGGPPDDLKICSGQAYCVITGQYSGITYNDGDLYMTAGSAFQWNSCRIVDAGGVIFYVGEGRDSYGLSPCTLVMSKDNGTVEREDMLDGFIYCTGGKPRLCSGSYPGYYCFSRACMANKGEDLYLVLTPEDGSCPVLRKNGTDSAVVLNGFLTGIELCVSPPS